MSQSTHAPYGHFVETTLSFEEAIREAKSALSAQGFGFLSEIDVAKTLKDKLGVDQTPLVILGACDAYYNKKRPEGLFRSRSGGTGYDPLFRVTTRF